MMRRSKSPDKSSTLDRRPGFRDLPRRNRKPRGKGGEPEREPVEPPNPKLLSGGAAAELEFDD